MELLLLVVYLELTLSLVSEQGSTCSPPPSLTPLHPSERGKYTPEYGCNIFDSTFQKVSVFEPRTSSIYNKARCDPVEYIYFKLNTEYVYKRKLNVSFEFCQFECEECWLLFRSNSDFLKKCGSKLSEVMFRSLVEECYKHLGNVDSFVEYLNNLEQICKEKTNEYFTRPWCACDRCLLLEEPSEQIWQDCIRFMSDSEKRAIRDECLEAEQDKDDFVQFQQNLLNNCSSRTAVNVSFPDYRCTRRDICLVFILDGCDYIEDWQFEKGLEFIRKVVSRFDDDIGPGKTRVGIVQSAYFNNVLELSLCSMADLQSVINATYYIPHRGGELGDYCEGEEFASYHLEDCCNYFRKKIFISITSKYTLPPWNPTETTRSHKLDIFCMPDTYMWEVYIPQSQQNVDEEMELIYEDIMKKIC